MQNLFDKASLVMVPSGYDNGKLYNIKPEDKSSAFEFERGSVATRVNSEGLIETSGTGKELIDYDTFYYGQGGWSLVDGKWVFDDVTPGHINIKANDIINVVVGETYEVTVDVSISSGDANFRVSSGNAQTILFNYKDFPDGVTKFTTTVTGVDGGISRLYAPTSLADGPFTLNSISIKKVYEDTPRIDYTSGEGALLLEPQRSNLVTTSNDFSSWITYPLTSTTILSPEGLNNASEFTIPSTNGRVQTPYVTVSPNTDYVFSFYVKRGTATNLQYRVYSPIDGDLVGAPNTNSYYSQTSSEEWTRIEVPFTTPATTTSISGYLDSDSRGDGTVYFYGVQIEGGSYATSYMPTYGSTATRTADYCENAGNDNIFNDTEGVLYAEISKKQDDNDTFILLSVNNAAANDDRDTVALGFDSDDDFFIRLRANSVNPILYNSVTANKDEYYKMALKYKSGDSAAYVNGVEVASTSATFSFLNALDNLSFDYNGNRTLPFHGNVKSVIYFPEVLTDEELQRLTSPSTDATTFTELANNNGYTIL